VQFEDTTRIDTPEGISLEIALAGLGSRFIAQALDGLVKGGAVLGLSLIVAAFGGSGVALQAIVAVGVFISFFVYDIVFETFWSGRTIGKRATGLRVVSVDGGPVGFFSSAVRNLLRIVDVLPGPYGVASIVILGTKRNQRLGDLAAGTLVVRERSQTPDFGRSRVGFRSLPAGFDVTGLTDEHLTLARQYVARREDLDPDRRRQLAEQVAGTIRPLVGPTGDGLSAEALIESVVVAKDR